MGPNNSLPSPIPQKLYAAVQEAFNQFDKNGDGTLKGKKEIVQSTEKRIKFGQDTELSVEKDMDIKAFYEKNKSIFIARYCIEHNCSNESSEFLFGEISSAEDMAKLSAETAFRDLDRNGNGKISKKESKGNLLEYMSESGLKFFLSNMTPQKGESMQEYVTRVSDAFDKKYNAFKYNIEQNRNDFISKVKKFFNEFTSEND